MGQLSNAFNNVSGTIERGTRNLGDSNFRSAGMLLNLNRQDRRDARQNRLDAENKEVRDLQMPSLKLKSAQAKAELEPVTFTLQDILPQGEHATMSNLGFALGADKNGSVPAIEAGRYVTGNPEYNGEPITVPRHKQKQMITHAMNYMLTKADPVYLAEGDIDDQKAKLKSITDPKERQALEAQIKQAEEFLKSPANRAKMYGQKTDYLMRMKHAAKSAGVDDSGLTHIDKSVARMSGKIKAIQDKITSDKEFGLKQRRVRAAEDTARAALNRSRRDKERSWSDINNEYKYKKAGFDAQFGADDGAGGVTYKPMTTDQKLKAEDYAQKNGIRLNIVPGEPKVTDNPGWLTGDTTTDMWVLQGVGPAQQNDTMGLTVPQSQGSQASESGVAHVSPGAKTPGKAANTLDELLQQTEGAQAPPDQLAASHGDAPVKAPVVAPAETQPQYTNVTVDERGTVWGVDASGQSTRIAVKPSEKIYNNQYANPEYETYINLLKQYGLN